MDNMKPIFYILIVIQVCTTGQVFCQNDTINTQSPVVYTLPDNSELFTSDELLRISLEFDISQYKKKRSDTEYLDAILTYYSGDNDSTVKEIKVRSRGVYRREYCDFPPLMLNFRKKDSTRGEFYHIDKLKMVTQCKPANEQYLLKEFLIYKLYNVLTDYSYRVRLLRVNYINTAKRSKPVSEYAFVIEPSDLLVRRLNSVEIMSANITQKNIKPEMMDRMAIFNYMIGNPDWSVPIQHNVLIITQPASERPDLGITIPFDFDFSGLVNTSYAIPFEGLRILTVRERIYLGICREEQAFINSLVEFSEKKEEFYKVINEFPYLNQRLKKEMISYLDEFYTDFDKRNSLAKKLLFDCLSF